MNGKEFAEHIGVAHGTVKRWLHEGLPVAKRFGRQIKIDPTVAKAWVEERFGKTIAFDRRSVVYFAARYDGAVKIGWTSDVMRRVFELRKDSRAPVELLACFPGTKPDELALHARFAAHRLDGEWYRRSPEIDAFIMRIGRSAA